MTLRAFVLACAAVCSCGVVTAGAQSAPYRPTGLTATVQGTTVTLSWRAATGAASYIVDAGTAHTLSDILQFPTGTSATSFTTTGVPDGNYYVRVRASGAAGTSGPSNEVTVTVGAACQPPPPPTFTASTSGSLVTLGWSAAGATGYRLEVGSTPRTHDIYDLDMGNTPGLVVPAPDGVYYARARAYNACALGNVSNEGVIAVNVPAAPTLLTASVIGSTVRLAWPASTDPSVTGYALSLGTSPGVVDLGTVPLGSVLSFNAGGVPAGTYFVRVVAVGATGAGPWSNELAVTVGAPPAGTTVVTFDSLPAAPMFTTHTEQGISVDALTAAWASGPALTSTNPSTATPMDNELQVAASGRAFQLVSLRLYSSVTPIPYVIRGVRNGVTVYTAAATVPNTFGAYATVPNPYATTDVDMILLTVTNPACPSCAGNPIGVDDIVVVPR